MLPTAKIGEKCLPHWEFQAILVLSSVFPVLTAVAFLIASALPFQCGVASFYGQSDGFHGLTTANGETFDKNAPTAAHPSLPFGTKLKVVNKATGHSTIVRINDRGPYIGQRIIDLSTGAFTQIAPASQGLADVCLYLL